jgi:hypothetical protein
MPAELAVKLAAFDGMEIIRGQVSSLIVAQAREHLLALEEHHAPPPPQRIELWARKLKNGVAPISEPEFVGRLSAIQEACGELPAWVWTSETLKIGWRTFKFFPTAFEVFDLLSSIANRGTLGMAQVRLLADAKPAPLSDKVVELPTSLVHNVVRSISRSLNQPKFDVGNVPPTPPGRTRDNDPIVAAARAQQAANRIGGST